MEKPFKGNAIFEQLDNNGIQITIPSGKDLGQIIFLGFWIIVWVCSLFFGINTVWGGPTLLTLIMMIWVVLWIIGGIFSIKLILWSIWGKEILIFSRDTVSMTIDVPFFGNNRVYDLNISRSFRVREEDYKFNGIFASRKNDFGKILPEGRIRFDYGMKTVKLAGGIDEAEAKYILSFLKEKNILQAEHFEK